MAWDKRLTVGIICGVAAIQAFDQAAKDFILTAGLANTLSGTWWWNYLPLALLSLAGLIWLFRVLRPRPPPPVSAGALTASQPANLKPLIEAFQEHAISERRLSEAEGAHGKQLVPNRDQLRSALKAMRDASAKLALERTKSAAETAVDHFDRDINISTGYAQFRSVTLALLKDLDADGRFLRAS